VPLFVPLFVLVFILCIIWAFLHRAFESTVRKRYPSQFEALGGPRGAFDYSLRTFVQWYGFVFRRQYRKLGDKHLDRLGNALLFVVIIMVGAWVTLMVAPKGAFIRLPF